MTAASSFERIGASSFEMCLQNSAARPPLPGVLLFQKVTGGSFRIYRFYNFI